ncbi:MAG: hypothetical protein ACPGJF_05585 [Sinimarinibacterium flocculans]|uniref:hypothetical protein n=1 Tax=Sinimarinibacterium flocculans TaxID=985250 RepID=UPI003C6725A9
MKQLLTALALAIVSTSTFATEYVQGYFRKDGTYVQGHYKSSPNANRYDNLSSQSMGGSKRDEFSRNPAYNKANPMYGAGDNDGDGYLNSYDPAPNSKCNYGYGC